MATQGKPPNLASHLKNRIRSALVSKERAWRHLQKRCLRIHQSPVREVVDTLVKHIDAHRDVTPDYEELDEVRTRLEAVINPEKLWLISRCITDSTRSICRSIMEELDQLPGQEDRTNVQQQHTEDIRSCYRNIISLLRSLELDIASWESYRQTGDLRWKFVQSLKLEVHDFDSTSYVNVHAVPPGLPPSFPSPGTQADTMAQLLSWIDTSTAGSIYWITGIAATRKTEIAYYLCEELRSRRILAASFFCSRSLPKCRDASLVIPCIAYQLAHFSYRFQSALNPILEKNIDILTSSPEQQFEHLLLAPFRASWEAFPTNLVVVIEALDGCEDKESPFRLLISLASAQFPIKFVVFTPPEPDLRGHLEELDADILSRIVLHDLDHPAVVADIETYFRTSLAPISPSAPEMASLVDLAGSSFSCAVTAVRFINTHQLTSSRRARLDALLKTLAPTLPTHRETEELYTFIEREAFARSNPSAEEATSTRHILRIIACAKELLTSDEIASLLEMDCDRVTLGLCILRPMIHTMKYDNRVVPLCATFSGCLPGPNERLCDPNHVLAHRCFDRIRDLKEQLNFNICHLESSYIMDADIQGLADFVKERVTPAIAYASRHWATHMCAAADMANLENRLKEFLTNHLLLWLEALNLTKHIEEGPSIVDMIEQWARQHVASPEIRQLAESASRFVKSFAMNPVSQSTPHIYLSTLASLPLFDPVRRLYGRRTYGGIQITGTALDRSLMKLGRYSTGGQVYSVAFDPDGTRIALGSGNDVQLVDALTGQPLSHPFQQHTWSVMSVTFSPDGKRIASGSRDKTICVWDSETGKLIIGPLTGHTGHVRSVLFSRSGAYLVSGSNDTTIRIWDTQSGQPKLEPILGHSDYVKSVAIFSDDSRIVSGSKDGTICIWDLNNGNLSLGPLGGHTDYVTSVSLSPDDSRIVSGSSDRTIRIWDSQSGQTVFGPLIGHKGGVLSVTFTPDGANILSSASDRAICIWDASTGDRSMEAFGVHQSHIYSISCSPDGSRIVSGSGDETFCLWKTRYNSADTEPNADLRGHSQPIKSIGISPSGTYLVSGAADHGVRVWDLSGDLASLGPLPGHTREINSVCFSYDGKMVISGSNDGTVRVWDAKTGVPVSIFDLPQRHNSRVNSVACAHRNPLIVCGTSDGIIYVWSYSSGELWLGPHKLHNKAVQVQSVEFSPDDSRIVAGSTDRTVYILDPRTGDIPLGPLLGHTGTIRSVEFSPDGSKIISASDDCTIHLWDAQNGQVISQLVGHDGPVLSAQFSPDGTLIASGSQDCTVCVWDVARGEMIMGPLRGHTDRVNSIAFLPDGVHVASASSDLTNRIWDIRPEPFTGPGTNWTEWRMDDDGWIVDGVGVKLGSGDKESKPRRLAWLDPRFRTSLMGPRNTALLSRGGYLKLEFDWDRLGESWTKIYHPE